MNFAPGAGIVSSNLGGVSPDILFWDLRYGEALSSWTMEYVPSWTLLSYDATWLAAGNNVNARLSLYNMPERTLRWSASYPAEGIRWVAVAPDGSVVAGDRGAEHHAVQHP